MVIRTFLVSVFLLLGIFCTSQSLRFEHLTSAEGISQSEVYTFLEDSKGFIWFGTIDGLNRYDGYKVEVFNTKKNDPHSLSNNTIRSLAEDQLGRIWIGTDDGLNLYDPKTELIFQVKVSSIENRFSVWSLFIANNRLLVGTSNGLWSTSVQSSSIPKIESEFQRISNFNNPLTTDNFVRTIINCRHGGIWIVTSENVSRIIFQEDPNEPVIIDNIRLDNFDHLQAATEDFAGNLWIASSEDGLLRYNPQTKTTDYFNKYGTSWAPSSRKCSSLAIDGKGNLWIGTLDRGLNFAKADEVNDKQIHFETIQNEPFDSFGLNSNLIYSLYISNDNLLWIGTIGAGINIFDPEQKKFTLYRFHNSGNNLSNSNFIRSVFLDRQNRIWTGTHGNGLFLYNRKKNEFQKLSFETLSVFFIYPTNENKKLICTGSGLYLVDLVIDKLKILDQVQLGIPVFYVTKGEGNVYWVASLNGLTRIEITNNKFLTGKTYSVDTSPKLSVNNCRVLLYNKNSNELLVGTEGGGLNIVLLDKNQIPSEIMVCKKDTSSNSISNNYIRSIIKATNGQIWIGTYEGLNKMYNDSLTNEIAFRSFTRKDGLPNNMIQLLIEDDERNLWIGTNGGLSRFNPKNEQFINYTVNDGLQSNEFSEHTAFKNTDGEIILGGVNGINAFYPSQIKLSTKKPQTTITDFYLFNKRVEALEKVGRNVPLRKSIVQTDTIFLLPNQKNFGFNFSAMIYPNAEKILYAYTLHGFDNEWKIVDAKNRMANYTNIKHGEYIFEVKSTNNDGIWDESPRTIYIKIKTPFIYTWYAYTLYTLIIILVFIYFSHFSIIRYTTKKKLVLEKEHNQKLHELDELRTKFFINISHDLRTPLTLISGPLESILNTKNLSSDIREKLYLIKRNVKRLNYLVNQLLDIRKAETGKLVAKLKPEDIVSFTSEEVAHFTYAIHKKGIQLNINCKWDKLLASFDPGMISKVYFNVISNAIKYTDKGKITINIDRVEKNTFGILKNASFETFVMVEIEDTGKGISPDQKEKIFERFYQDQKNSGNGYGIGLSHTKELIEAHHGFIEVDSTENIGTVVRFFLPDAEISDYEKISKVTSTEDIYVDASAEEVMPVVEENNMPYTVLVVEDNDDMRSFMHIELKRKYNVIEASDGVEGLRMAVTKMPDLIISDIMMPRMDGIEFCKQIKSNIETSHIPVILLTAKIDTKTKYEGIETGADDYILKPFETEYLILRTKNLLNSREQLRKKFQSKFTLEPSTVTVTSIDEKFLSSLMKAIEAGIPDSDFSVGSLESEMGMSHANFYRKVKSLTGHSGQELLVNMRMKRAHQILLENKGVRISEVAYMVGFNNPKYFSKCFREVFGFAPSELSK